MMMERLSEVEKTQGYWRYAVLPPMGLREALEHYEASDALILGTAVEY
jgi:hypothetical protein